MLRGHDAESDCSHMLRCTDHAAFQPALTRRTALRTATPPAFSASATRRRPCLAVSAGGASPGGRLAALLRALRSAGTVSGLFFAAGLAEIGGGWLVWKAVREGAPRWWAACGALVLAAYGFIPCLQPIDDFGRLYAAYGGRRVFIGSLTGRRPRRWGLFIAIASPGPGSSTAWPSTRGTSSAARSRSSASRSCCCGRGIRTSRVQNCRKQGNRPQTPADAAGSLT